MFSDDGYIVTFCSLHQLFSYPVSSFDLNLPFCVFFVVGFYRLTLVKLMFSDWHVILSENLYKCVCFFFLSLNGFSPLAGCLSCSCHSEHFATLLLLLVCAAPASPSWASLSVFISAWWLIAWTYSYSQYHPRVEEGRFLCHGGGGIPSSVIIFLWKGSFSGHLADWKVSCTSDFIGYFFLTFSLYFMARSTSLL